MLSAGYITDDTPRKSLITLILTVGTRFPQSNVGKERSLTAVAVRMSCLNFRTSRLSGTMSGHAFKERFHVGFTCRPNKLIPHFSS
jgi:hypothetical protein